MLSLRTHSFLLRVLVCAGFMVFCFHGSGPILNQLEAEFRRTQPFAGKKVAICLHLEAKTAYLALVIQAGGAQVSVAAKESRCKLQAIS